MDTKNLSKEVKLTIELPELYKPALEAIYQEYNKISSSELPPFIASDLDSPVKSTKASHLDNFSDPTQLLLNAVIMLEIFDYQSYCEHYYTNSELILLSKLIEQYNLDLTQAQILLAQATIKNTYKSIFENSNTPSLTKLTISIAEPTYFLLRCIESDSNYWSTPSSVKQHLTWAIHNFIYDNFTGLGNKLVTTIQKLTNFKRKDIIDQLKLIGPISYH